MKRMMIVLGLVAVVALGVTYVYAQGPGYGRTGWGYGKWSSLTPEQETKLQELQVTFEEKKSQGKKIESIVNRIEKTKLDLKLTKLTKEYNLGTSLKSYIDPRAYVKWADSVDFSLEKFYPKTLRKKFSWAIESETECYA